MVLANSAFTQSIRQFAQREDFRKIFQISSEQQSSQRDVEYVVRLIVHALTDFDRALDVQEFLDVAIVEILTNKDQVEVMSDITWVVEVLYRVFGERALFPPAQGAGDVAPRFSLRALEAIAVGILRNKAEISALNNSDDFIKEKVESFWQQPQVPEMSASGLRGTVRLQRTIPFGSNWFKPNA